MNVDWDIGQLVATALGGLLAAGAGWLASLQERGQRKEDFQAEVQERRTDVAWDRAYDKADGIVRALERVKGLAFKAGRAGPPLFMWGGDDATSKRIAAQLDEIRSASIYLPEPTRGQVQTCVTLLWSIDGMNAMGYLDVWPRSAAYKVIEFGIESVGRHLRQEKPADPPKSIADLVKSMGDYENEIQQQMEEEEQERRATDPDEVTPDPGND